MAYFTYIDSKTALEEAAKQWGLSSDLAVDLECENNLHHYGAYISLIQISNGVENWIVDVLTLKEINPVIEVLENKSIQKVFHDVGFDFRILYEQFSCRPKNIFDTQIAALLLGKENIGLGALLEEYLGIHKEKKFQMADWTKRPISTVMLEYAVTDIIHLLPLREILKRELTGKSRLSWAKEEFAVIENTKFNYVEQDFMDVRGVKELSEQQLGIFKQLFFLRKQLAQEVDHPVHFVISIQRLKEFAVNPAVNWSSVRSVHPIVRIKAKLFQEAVEKGKREPVQLVKIKRKYSTVEEKEKFEQLYELQAKLAAKLNIKGHLIINKEQMNKIVFNHDFRCLRNWQRKLLAEEGYNFL